MKNEVSLKQSKYNGVFSSDLDTSQELVDDICVYLKKYELYVRSQDDATPFINLRGNELRLCDIQAVYKSKLRLVYIEAKDYARCVYHQVTGHAKRYIDGKLKLLNGGDNVFMIFRENMELVEERVKISSSSKDDIIDDLIEEGVASRREDGSIYFVPYGHRLSFLLRDENMMKDLEKRVPCRLSQYRGEGQYLWKTEVMLPIDKLIEQEIIK